MGRKQEIPRYTCIDSVSMATDITSTATNCSQIDIISFDIYWGISGSPVGEIKVQVSTDNTTFDDLDFDTTIAVSSAETHARVEVHNTAFKYIRLFYDRTSGTGTMIAVMAATTVGA